MTGVREIEDWFIQYISRFYNKDERNNFAVRMKKDHTLRVRDNIKILCKGLGMSEKESRIAETIALLHDVGRFRQFAVYKTFNDRQSINHAKWSLKEIAAEGLLNHFNTNEKRVISNAIAYHNAYQAPKHLNGDRLFFFQLIRDADKLDIWEVLIDYYCGKKEKNDPILALNIPDTDAVSQPVIDMIKRSQLVRIKDVRTLTDLKLFHISWVYDINVKPAFKLIKKRKIIERIEAVLPKKNSLSHIVKEAANYVNFYC